MPRTRTLLSLLLAGASAPALAAPHEFVLDVELPRIAVAEYHKPYVSAWVEDQTGKPVGQLALWYDVRKKDDGGKKYLPDVKTWWRKGGRSLTLPIAGVTGATRAPGRNMAPVPAEVLSKLPAGQYSLVVEAAREAGGREVVKAPFAWKSGGAVDAVAKGTGELGTVRLSAR